VGISQLKYQVKVIYTENVEKEPIDKIPESRDTFINEILQLSKKRISVLHKIFQTTEMTRIFSNSFYQCLPE
jgi:hypothetical protein